MAFMNRVDLESVEINGNVAPFAFYGCTNLKRIRFGPNSQTIGEYAFYGCKAFEDVVIPTTVKQIGDCAFAACSGVIRFTNPMTTTTDPTRKISNSAFVGCGALLRIVVDNGSGESLVGVDYLSNLSGFLFNRIAGPVAQQVDTFLSVDPVTKICSGFRTADGYPQPAYIAFPAGTVTLAPHAFKHQVGIEGVVIPSTMTRTGEFAFYGCTQLKIIYIADNLPLEISAYSFYGCTSLTQILLLRTTASVGDCAFGNSGLTTINIEYSWGFTFPIAQSAFYSRVAAASFVDPSNVRTSVATITDGTSPRVTNVSQEATTFLAIDPVSKICTGFLAGSTYPRPEILVIPNGVREISAGAFAGETGITAVFLPSSVTAVGANAFAGCSALSTVFYRSQSAFDGITIGVGAYTGTTYIADMLSRTPVTDVVITSPTFDIVSVVWTPTTYTFYPRMSYDITVSGDLVATLVKPTPLSSVLTLADARLYVVNVQAKLFGSDAWGTPQTLVVDNRSVGQTPTWWPNYLAQRSSLENTLAERYAPQLLSVSNAYPLTYYLSDGGTISGGLTEYAVTWSRRTSLAAHVMLLFIYRVMLESADTVVARRGKHGIVQLIPQIIQMPPASPTVSATVFADSVYCKWTRPAYFWDCFASYRVYVDAGPVVTDTSGTQALLNGLSVGTHTIGISTVNLLGMEGVAATITVTINDTGAADVVDPPVHTLLKDGSLQVRVNDPITLAEDPVVRGYIRMLGGPCIEVTAAAPRGVSLDFAGDSQLTASWTAPEVAAGLSAPINYLVTATNRTNPSMSRTFDAGTANSTSYVLSGLVGWDFYVVSVQAVYEEGVSAPSAPSAPIQVVSVPPAPTGLTLELTSAGGIQMDWDWYYISQFARILSHTVEIVDVNNPSGTQMITDIVSRPLILPNQSSVYKFRVRAVNRFGAGPWSAYSRRLGAYAAPDAPVLTTVIAQGKSPDMRFVWTTDNPGPDISEFILTLNDVEIHLPPSVTEYLVTDQPYGTNVTATVRAVNVNGIGEPSNTVSLMAVATPDTPTWVDVQERDLHVTLTWMPPNVTGGLPILDYKVFVYNQDVDELFEYTTANTTFVPPILTDGATYNFAVSARNAKGEGDRIAWPEPVVAFLAMPPSEPVAVDIDIGTWDAPMTDGGAEIEGYEVRVYTVSGSEPIVFDVGAEERSIGLGGLPLEEIYCMTVAARNRRGLGLVAVALVAGILPIVAVPSGDRSIRVSWPALSANGFPGVRSYGIRAVLGDDERYAFSEDPVVEFTDLLINRTVPDLVQNDMYMFEIVVNYSDECVGPPFLGETMCAPVTAPSLVQNLTVAQEFDDRIVIEWAPPVDNGGAPITEYVYTIIGPFSRLTYTVDDATLAVANKPRDAGSYTIHVTAANAHVKGATAEFSPFIYTTLPGMPRQLTLDAVDSTAAIARWLAPLSAGGLPVISYDMEYYADSTPDSAVRASTGTDFAYKMLTGMDSEETYHIRVRTVTSKGVSDWSEFTIFSFSEDLPPMVNVTVAQSGGDLIVTWNEIPDAQFVVAVNSVSSPDTFGIITPEYLSAPSFVYTPPTDGIYTFRVMAVSVVGAGQWSYSEPITFTRGGGETGGTGVICFLGNAPVLTPAGYKRIDRLRTGDQVQTADGRAVVIQRVVHQRVRPGHATSPYRIRRGQFGASRAIWISPEHRVSVPGRGMVEARHLGLTQMEHSSIDMLDYYNLELPDWDRDNMIVAGVEVESMAPFRRIRVTHREFMGLLRESHGETITQALVEQLRQKCVFFTDGTVEIPILRPARSTILSL